MADRDFTPNRADLIWAYVERMIQLGNDKERATAAAVRGIAKIKDDARAKPFGRAPVDSIAAAIAEADSADYWVQEIADWENSEEWKREAYPDEYPSSAYEDRERYRKQARAAVLALEPEGRLTRAMIEAGARELDEGAADAPQDHPLLWEAALSQSQSVLEAALGVEPEAREESEGDEPDTSLDDCRACDTALSDCSPDEACCEDCSHTANWSASEASELEREKARAWETLSQHPIFEGSEGLARIQALAMWRKLDSLVDVPAPEAREVTDAEVEAAARVMFETPDITSTGSDYTWAIMQAEDKSRADIWRADARAILEAAREVSRG